MPAPRPEETRGAKRPSSDHLDPAFVRRLEDDSLWRASDRPRPARSRPPLKEPRSVLLAVIVFVIAAVAIIVIGVTVGGGDAVSPGGGQSSPFSLLPLPTGPVTTTTETGASSAFDVSRDTSTPLTTVPVAVVLGR